MGCLCYAGFPIVLVVVVVLVLDVFGASISPKLVGYSGHASLLVQTDSNRPRSKIENEDDDEYPRKPGAFLGAT